MATIALCRTVSRVKMKHLCGHSSTSFNEPVLEVGNRRPLGILFPGHSRERAALGERENHLKVLLYASCDSDDQCRFSLIINDSQRARPIPWVI